MEDLLQVDLGLDQAPILETESLPMFGRPGGIPLVAPMFPLGSAK